MRKPQKVVSFVRLYNRRDPSPGGIFQSFFQTVQIWLANAAGEPDTSAFLCGEATYNAALEPNPYVIECASTDVFTYVTLLQTGPASYLTLAEVEIFHRIAA